MTDRAADSAEWWRTAVIYEIYPRSFVDGNGDGVGDLAGARAALPYLRDLGVDAIWFTPWYASPLIDGGYDVADYRAIHPELGTLAEAEALIAEAADLGIRTIVDVVPNHISSQHPWFVEALASEPGSASRDRFWFRDGRGEAGEQPPTHWPSSFHGATWTRVPQIDGTPGQWYLHLFTPEQPDLNWDNPEVIAEHEAVLRFWFDRGVAGIRVDSAALLVKDRNLPEVREHHEPGQHPTTDRDEVHEVYRAWRRVTDEYEGRVLVGEVWLPDPARFAAYLRTDEMHTAFNFDFMVRPWDARQLRQSIDTTLEAHRPVGAPTTWVLSNHDITRPVTRYGREDSGFGMAQKRFGTPTDLALGSRRARAAALLTAALPGVLYIYQGDELGLPEVEDIPDDARRDPMYLSGGGVDPGRDGCRVPLPWDADAPNRGFSPTPVPTWLPQPEWWGDYAAATQAADPDSMLSLYQAAIALRRSHPALSGTEFGWIDGYDADVLAFRRGNGAQLTCLVNLGRDAVVLPPDAHILLSSAPLLDGRLEPDNAVWLENNHL